MDLESAAIFQKIFEVTEDEFLAARAAHFDSCFGDEPFSLPDATGYPGKLKSFPVLLSLSTGRWFGQFHKLADGRFRSQAIKRWNPNPPGPLVWLVHKSPACAALRCGSYGVTMVRQRE